MLSYILSIKKSNQMPYTLYAAQDIFVRRFEA